MSKSVQRVVVVMLENALRADVLANRYMSELRKKGAFLGNSYGVTHSSQPNYIAAVGGDTFGLYDDTPGYVQWIYESWPNDPPVSSIADLLEAAGLTWKNYAENLPPTYKQSTRFNPDESYADNVAQIPPDVFPFARRHAPFLSFPNIVSDPHRLANIVDGDQLTTDLEAGTLPHFSWYTPNLVNDGHSLAATEQKYDRNDENRAVNIDNIEAFLKRFLGDDPVGKFPPETLIVITFDEAYPYSDPYQIYTLLIGDMLQAGTVRAEAYNHYSLLRSVETIFRLGSLHRNDAVASPYWFLRD